jgi:hypothetical protein
MSSLPILSLCAVAAGISVLALRSRRPSVPGTAPADPDGPQDEPGKFPLALTPGPRPVVITEKARFQHLEIVGSSGTGKNYHGLLPMIHQDMQRGAGLIIVDPKGAMRRTITAYAHACGRAKDLRCLDLGDPATSDTYNPFVGDDPTLVAERAHAAFYAADATPTSFYRDTALSFFYSFFGLCRRLEVLPTPEQLRSLALDQEALSALIALAPRSPEARDLRRRSLRQAPQEYAKNLQGMANALTPLTSGSFARLLNTTSPGIVVGDIIQNGGILYAGLASDQYPSLFKRVSTLLLMDLQASLTRRYLSQAPPAFVYLDEFADLLYPQVGALIAKAREARVGLVLAHQSLGDLARQGKATGDAIFENTANKVLLRQGGADSALALARLSGTKSGDRISYSINRTGIRGQVLPRTLSPSQDKEHLFDTNALMNLAVGEAFMIVQNSKGRELTRGHLLKAPEPKPFRTRQSRRKNKAYRPLELGPTEETAIPGPKPSTPLAVAALQRMQRSRKHGH